MRMMGEHAEKLGAAVGEASDILIACIVSRQFQGTRG